VLCRQTACVVLCYCHKIYLKTTVIKRMKMVECALFRKPVHPEYANFGARLQTFKKWPKEHVKKGVILAQAGFFHNGIEDEVLCYQCNGGLKQWIKEDIVWELHAKYFGVACSLVLDKFGDKYLRGKYQQKY